MSKETKIQWCDSTVNPIMGCGGCELFPAPTQVLKSIDEELCGYVQQWRRGDSKMIFIELVQQAMKDLLGQIGQPLIGHHDSVTTTNIYHLRRNFAVKVEQQHGSGIAKKATKMIEQSVTCYASKLHLNRGRAITNPTRKVNTGYAPTFETITQFAGRMREAAAWCDLKGTERSDKSWLKGLPRLIFLSDMGDALSRKSDFSYLRREFQEVESAEGQQHLWLWLTKRTGNMRSFAKDMGGLPPNVCAMTTVTSDETLRRVDDLRSVDANVRGLSIEPLWSPVASQLDLEGIDWVIVGGESGGKDYVRPFDIEWAMDLRERCRESGTAFFLKQIGNLPVCNDVSIKQAGSDPHGGDWDYWPSELKVREMPDYFHSYAQRILAAA